MKTTSKVRIGFILLGIVAVWLILSPALGLIGFLFSIIKKILGVFS